MVGGGAGAGRAGGDAVAGDGAASPGAGDGRMPGGAPGVASPSSSGVADEAGVPDAARRRRGSRGPRDARGARSGCARSSRRSAARPRPGPAGSSPPAAAPAAGRSPPATAAASPRPSDSGSSTTSSVPARRASAASRPSRSPTRFPAIAGSRPSGRSTTSRSTVRAARSAARHRERLLEVGRRQHDEPLRADAAGDGLDRDRTSGRGPATRRWRRRPGPRPRPAARASSCPSWRSPAARRSPMRGSPPVPRIASRAANPVGTTRPSASCAGCAAAWRRGRERAGSGDRVEAGSRVLVRRPRGAGPPGRAAPSVAQRERRSTSLRPSSPPRRGAAAPQRAWSVASASETSDERAIGRRIIERMFYSVKGFRAPDCHPVSPRLVPASPRLEPSWESAGWAPIRALAVTPRVVDSGLSSSTRPVHA